MKKLLLLAILIHMPIICMKRSHDQQIIDTNFLKKRKFNSSSLNAKELEIKKRVFTNFMERYHHIEYCYSAGMPSLCYKTLKANFFNNNLDPNYPHVKLLIDDYNEIMSEWFSNFE